MTDTPPDRSSYVFLSYASTDRERALHIADLLEAQGIPVWIDRKSIAGGSSWSAEIVRGIRDCAAFLVACSPSAMASPNVQQEVQLAFETRRPILPLLLAPTELPDAVRYALAGRQWIELPDRADATGLPQLIQAIRTVSASPSVAKASASTSEAASRFSAASLASVGRHNLPAQVTSFVGRERERAEIKELLGSTRLLTLTGTGGCGKTRLALEVAGDLAPSYEDGIWLVELAPLADPGSVPSAVATAIGVADAPGQSIHAALVSYLRPRRLLIVLDNCEHLIDACAQLANAILRGCPEVQILATSRESLAIAGEIAWRVPSLDVAALEDDDDPAVLASNAAVRLFAERARSAHPSFALTDHSVVTAARICRRLDGIPLAIELAAGRVKALSVEQIAARLDQQFRLLTGGSRAALPRQQTLAALVGWSYDLLTPAEQTLFSRLSVFAGGWTLEAAEAVCGGDVGDLKTGEVGRPDTRDLIPDTQVLDLLTGLVDKSLVVAIEGAEGVERYRLLETLRQFGRDRLVAVGEAEAMHRRHAAYYRAMVLAGAGEQFYLLATRDYRDRLRRESDNLQASLRWYVECGESETGLKLLNELPSSFYLLWDLSEMASWFDRLIALLPASATPLVRLRGLVTAATMLKCRGESEQARRYRDEALAFAKASGDPYLLARANVNFALWFRQPGYNLANLMAALDVFRDLADVSYTILTLFTLGRNCCWADQLERGRAFVDEGLALARQGSAPHRIAFGLEVLGELATPTDPAEARRHLNESLRLYQQIGDRWGIVSIEFFLGRADLLEGKYEEAAPHFQTVLTMTRRWLLFDRITQALDGLAAIAVTHGQPERALRLASVSARERLTRVENFSPIEVAEIQVWLDQAHSTLGEAAATRAWSEGLALTLDEAIAYALNDAPVFP